MAIVIMIDGWIVDRIFDDDEGVEAEEYMKQFNPRRYRGHASRRHVPDNDLAEGLHSYDRALGMEGPND